MKHILLPIFLLVSIITYSQNSINNLSGETVYSWETQQAKVLPNGDLQWAALPFQLLKGSSVRYIDFDNGNNSNDGLTTATPWKHHPWDA